MEETLLVVRVIVARVDAVDRPDTFHYSRPFRRLTHHDATSTPPRERLALARVVV